MWYKYCGTWKIGTAKSRAMKFFTIVVVEYMLELSCEISSMLIAIIYKPHI